MKNNFIEGYKFGKIKINGEVYTDDVILLGDEVKEGWWRKKGHQLSIEDLQEIIDYDPELLIIGTGSAGRLTVPDSMKTKVDFKILFYPTEKACKVYNKKLSKHENIAGAFHLTC